MGSSKHEFLKGNVHRQQGQKLFSLAISPPGHMLPDWGNSFQGRREGIVRWRPIPARSPRFDMRSQPAPTFPSRLQERFALLTGEDRSIIASTHVADEQPLPDWDNFSAWPHVAALGPGNLCRPGAWPHVAGLGEFLSGPARGNRPLATDSGPFPPIRHAVGTSTNLPESTAGALRTSDRRRSLNHREHARG